MLELKKPNAVIKGSVQLPQSKSMANRLLILQAQTDELTASNELQLPEDTRLLKAALLKTQNTDNATLDIGHAGTAMRFLTAYLSCKEGTWILTGSERMKERPLGALVESLQQLGAQIDYLEKTGFPPLKIIGKKIVDTTTSISGEISSQFISALILSAPAMQNGLTIQLNGQLVSEPYIDLTLSLMTKCGIAARRTKNDIYVPAGKPVQPKDFKIESDWSAASYYYMICALSPGSEIILKGLVENSLQADAILPELFSRLGVETRFEEDKVYLKHKRIDAKSFNADFSKYPDIAQTIAVTCFALGLPAKLSGLKTLKIKETDRIQAIKIELEKFGAKVNASDDFLEISGNLNSKNQMTVNTYQDHRMAMSFAPLALCLPAIRIQDPEVVVKSYPGFWEDLISLGFSVNLQPQ